MIYKIVLGFCLLLTTITSIAQQETSYSIFWNNPSIYNPATTGEQSKFYGAINYRNQWNQMSSPGHPWDVTGLFEMRFDSLNSAIGINYGYNQLGLEKAKHIGINYSYHINLSNNRKVGFGVGYVLTAKYFDYSNFISIDDYTQDPSIPNKTEKLNSSDFNVGVSYLSEKFKVGVGMTQITESSVEVGDRIFQNQMNLFTNGSYEFLMGSDFKLIPQVRFVTDFTSRNYEASLIAKFNNRYWVGASYRSEVALGILAGVDIAEKIRLGYAFDYYNNRTLDFNFGGAHEIVFALMLD